MIRLIFEYLHMAFLWRLSIRKCKTASTQIRSIFLITLITDKSKGEVAAVYQRNISSYDVTILKNLISIFRSNFLSNHLRAI